jgi:hypothetical protein
LSNQILDWTFTKYEQVVGKLVRTNKVNPDLMGLGSLVSDKFFILKHSDKKVLGLSVIAVAIGMYRP